MASKARQAQSRLKALERMTLSAPAEIDSGLEIRFRAPDRLVSPLLRLDEADIGYDGVPWLRHVQLGLYPGARMALLGPNGAGKSTLVKALVGELPLLAGTRLISEHTRIGYFAQHQVDHLDVRATPLLMLQRLSPKTDELTLRSFLGGFGFGGDRVTSVIEPFSGGEKARLALALIVWQRPNVLLLDEPTNHLDLATREALSVALNEFEGTVMLVSHDRALLRAVCDEFWLVSRGGIAPFDGDLDDYQRYLLEESKRLREEARLAEQAQVAGGNTAAAAPSPAVAPSAPAAAPTSTPAAPAARDGREQRKIDAQTRQQLAEKTRPLKKELEQIDKRLAALSVERASLEQKLTEPLPPAEIAECGRRLKVGNDETAQLEERWLEISSELEEISAAA